MVGGDAYHELALVDIDRATTESVHPREEGGLVAVEREGRGDTAEDAQGNCGVKLGRRGGFQEGGEECDGWVLGRVCEQGREGWG